MNKCTCIACRTKYLIIKALANDLAYRDKVELVGVIVASEQFNPVS